MTSSLFQPTALAALHVAVGQTGLAPSGIEPGRRRTEGTERDREGQSETERDRAERTRTWRNSAGQDGAGRNMEGRNGTKPGRAGMGVESEIPSKPAAAMCRHRRHRHSHRARRPRCLRDRPEPRAISVTFLEFGEMNWVVSHRWGGGGGLRRGNIRRGGAELGSQKTS